MNDHPLPSTPALVQSSRWYCLVELSLRGPIDLGRLILTPISQAYQALGVPTAYQDRLTTALVEAITQLYEYRPDEQSACLVSVRLLVLQPLVGLYTSAQGMQPPPSTTSNPPASNGWSFFIVEHNSGDLPIGSVIVDYVIEVFLYREGA